MGSSSKKKHKKHKSKDKKRTRSRDSSCSSSLGSSIQQHHNAGSTLNSDSISSAMGAANNQSYLNDQQQQYGGISTTSSSDNPMEATSIKQQPLRLVLKVPASCYSSSTAGSHHQHHHHQQGTNNSGSHNNNVSPSIISGHNQIHNEHLNSQTIANYAYDQPHHQQQQQQSMFSMDSMSLNSGYPMDPMNQMDDMGTNLPSSVGSLSSPPPQTELSYQVSSHQHHGSHSSGNNNLSMMITTQSSSSSKKPKKSKKSKKSKHRKHSHHHSHSLHSHRHHHRKHHHGGGQSSNPLTTTSSPSITSSSAPALVGIDCHQQQQQQSQQQWLQPMANSNVDNSSSLISPSSLSGVDLQASTQNIGISNDPYGTNSNATNNISPVMANYSVLSSDHNLLQQSQQQQINSIEEMHDPNQANSYSSAVPVSQWQSFYSCDSMPDNNYGINNLKIESQFGQSTTNSQPEKLSDLKLKLSKSSSCQYNSHQLQQPQMHRNTSTAISAIPESEPQYISPNKSHSSISAFNLDPNECMPIVTDTGLLPESNNKESSHSSKSSHKSSSKNKEDKSTTPLQLLLMHLTKQLQRKDSEQFFASPVSDSIAPGYSLIITNPMDLSTIKNKVSAGLSYKTLGDFKADVKLMCDNAMKYNRPDTIYYKCSSRLWHYTKSKLFKKDALLEYSKVYSRLTPLELSLVPSQSPNKVTTTNSGNDSFSPDKMPISGGGGGQITGNFTSGLRSSMEFDSLYMGNGIGPGMWNISSGMTSFNCSSSDFNHSPIKFTPDVDNQANNQSHKKAKKAEACIDGLSHDEFMESIRNSARQAHEALKRSSKKVKCINLSYLSEGNDDQTLLTTIGSDSSSEVSVQVKPVTLNSIYSPSETGRIELNLLSTGLLTDQANQLKQNTNEDKSDLKEVTSKTADIKKEPNHNPGDLKALNAIGIDDHQRSEDQDKDKKEEEANLMKSLISSYGGDEFGLEYALSIAKFARSNEYTVNLVTSLLGVLTSGQHRTNSAKFYKLLNQQPDL